MIEASRRHGFFDPRFSGKGSCSEHASTNGQIWIDRLPDGLDWVAFSSRLLAGRRRHDLEALKAYEAYRNRLGEGDRADTVQQDSPVLLVRV